MPKVVYVLVNEAMEGLVKIGVTEKSLELRLRELHTTGVPFPFICKHAVEIPDEDEKQYENLLHKAFSSKRVNPKREFFEVHFEEVIAAMHMITGNDITPSDESEGLDEEELKAVRKHSRRRPPFSFEKVDIKRGETIHFLKDDSKTAEVVNDRKINFRGKETSMSKAALEVLLEKGNKPVAVAGPEYWEYNGETLSERRRRIEEESSEDYME